MQKNMIFLDLNKFNSESRAVYKIIVRGIFKHRIVRTTDDKVKLLEELVEKLPLKVEGDPRKIKIVTIVKLINNVADTHGEEELYYTTKKLYNNKNNKVSYTTGYFFKFK